jgi:hypothetical protein
VVEDECWADDFPGRGPEVYLLSLEILKPLKKLLRIDDSAFSITAGGFLVNGFRLKGPISGRPRIGPLRHRANGRHGVAFTIEVELGSLRRPLVDPRQPADGGG